MTLVQCRKKDARIGGRRREGGWRREEGGFRADMADDAARVRQVVQGRRDTRRRRTDDRAPTAMEVSTWEEAMGGVGVEL